MIALLILCLSLIAVAVAVRMLQSVWLKSGRKAFFWLAYAISFVALGTAFYVVQSGVVPRSVFSVLLVFASMVYFAIQGYLILRIELRKTG